MSRRERGTSLGKVGSAAKMTESSDRGHDREYDLGRREEPVIPEGHEPMDASVGLSIGVTMSTKYVRQKIDVTAWCTLPTYSDRASRDVVFEECYGQVMGEIESRLHAISTRFFPDVAWEEPD